MKPKNIFAALILAGAACAMLPPAAFAGMPQPMCVYYGQARDGYGLPYMQDADVILRHGTNEIARHKIHGSLSPGVNFALNVHLDDGKTAPSYSSRALHSGDLVSIIVSDRGSERTIMENQAVPAVGLPGELILRNVTAADDADGDGLSDTWESELIAWSGGLLLGLTDVRGEDDFDGDGVSNGMEYLAGTFAFLNYDYFFIEQSALSPNRRLQLSFLSVPGKTYSVESATNLTQTGWTPCEFALSDTALLQTKPAEGNGYWFSLYVPVAESPHYFRLGVK